MADTSFIIHKPKDKSFDENTEQIDIDSIEWKNYGDNICSQCGNDHSYKVTADSVIQSMISILDRKKSENI
jgi:tRNA A58 N-methylase Trm61